MAALLVRAARVEGGLENRSGGNRRDAHLAFMLSFHIPETTMPSPVPASITQAVRRLAFDALLPAGGELSMLVAGAVAGGAFSADHPLLLGHPMSMFGALIGWAINRWGGRPLLRRHGRCCTWTRRSSIERSAGSTDAAAPACSGVA